MPHIVLENINDTEEAYNAVENFAQKIEGGILKVMDKYLNANHQTVLIEALAIENGKKQKLFCTTFSKEKVSHCETLAFN